MRSLLSLPASSLRRGLGVLAVSALSLTSSCSIITGIPSVKSVDVSVAPESIPVNGTASATGVIHGDGSRIIVSSKVPLAFESSNPSIATVNTVSGLITGVSVGTTEIRARARGKTSEPVIVTVYPERPARINAPPPTIYVGTRVPFPIDPIAANGNSLGKRNVSAQSSNTGIVQVEGDGTTTGMFLRGVSVGNATINGTVDGTAFQTSVAVLPPLVAKVQAALAKGNNTLLEGESNQLSVALFAADNSSIPLANQSISYQSDDQTVATVSPSGIVTGQKAGTATITVSVGGSSATAKATITVQQVPAVIVQFQNRGQYLRLTTSGTGVQSNRVAVAFDSAGKQLANRQITYRSTDPTIFSVNAAGIVFPQALGVAKLIASADGGKVADTLNLTVTPVPVTNIQITPSQVTLDQDQTQQFTATVTDSLQATVTGRTITWLTSSPQVVTVDATGLATAKGAGSATIGAQVAIVPGLPGVLTVQGASVLVLPKPVASITVVPSPVTVQVNKQTQISLTLKDAAGNTIFTARSINVSVADPTIVTVQASNGTGTGIVAGLKQGSTTATFQALDTAGNPQGAPTTVTITVTP